MVDRLTIRRLSDRHSARRRAPSRYGPAGKGLFRWRRPAKDTHFGFRRGAARRQAGAGRRRVPHRRAPLRPDERPDVGRAAPRLEGRAGHRRQSAAEAATRAVRAARSSPAAPATSRSAWSRPAAPARASTVVDINAEMLTVGRERAAERGARRRHHLRRGQCRGAAVSRPQLRRRHHRLRHPQRAAHRRGARRGASRAAARRALPLPGILHRRRAGARRALRSLFVQRDPGARPRRRRRRRGLSLSGGIDPPLSAARRVRRDDARGRLPPRRRSSA